MSLVSIRLALRHELKRIHNMTADPVERGREINKCWALRVPTASSYL